MRVRALIAAAVLGILCAFLVACGDRSKLIPSADAGRLQGDMDNLQRLVTSGECTGVRPALQQLQDDVVQLPSSVDVRLRNRISEGVAALISQAPEACAQAQTETETTPTDTETETTTTETETETTTTDTETTPTETTPTETTPTETTPTETTPTETTPTETTPPPTEGTGGAGVTPGGTP